MGLLMDETSSLLFQLEGIANDLVDWDTSLKLLLLLDTRQKYLTPVVIGGGTSPTVSADLK
jgi:hypothetical protein